MTMLETMAEVFAVGGVPVRYTRARTLFGNEATFRWKKYPNSAADSIKVSFNVGDLEHDQCVTVFAAACKDQGINFGVMQ
jgi:hypothetical protein